MFHRIYLASDNTLENNADRTLKISMRSGLLHSSNYDRSIKSHWPSAALSKWMILFQFKQVPEIPIQVFEDGHNAIVSFVWLSHKLYSLRNHLIVVAPKVVSVEK